MTKNEYRKSWEARGYSFGSGTVTLEKGVDQAAHDDQDELVVVLNFFPICLIYSYSAFISFLCFKIPFQINSLSPLIPGLFEIAINFFAAIVQANCMLLEIFCNDFSICYVFDFFRKPYSMFSIFHLSNQ